MLPVFYCIIKSKGGGQNYLFSCECRRSMTVYFGLFSHLSWRKCWFSYPIVKIVAGGQRPWCQLASKSPYIRLTAPCFFTKKGNFIEALKPNKVPQGYSRCYKLNSQIFWLIWNSFWIFRSPRLANNRNKWLILNFPSLPYLASNTPKLCDF